MALTKVRAMRRRRKPTDILCRVCAATPEMEYRKPCSACLVGLLDGRIRELEAGFNYEFVMNTTYGRCGHQWRGDKQSCPWCALIIERDLYKRMVEAAHLVEAV